HGYFEESLAIYRACGDERGVTATLHNLGAVAVYERRWTTAAERFEEALALARELGSTRWTLEALAVLTLVDVRLGLHARARAALAEALRLAIELESVGAGTKVLEGAGELAHAVGDDARAAQFFGAAEGVRAATGIPRERLYEELLSETLAQIRSGLGNEG